MLALSAVPSLLVLGLLVKLPDTARWYLMKGRREDAREALERTDPDADVEHELGEIEADLHAERGGSVREMLQKPYARATMFVLGLGFLIQITGINAVVFYSPLIFKEMGFTGNAALLLLPALVQVGSLIATIVSLAIVDRLGRRPTLLTGIAAMIASTLLLVAVFAAGSLTGTTGWLGFAGIFIFTAGFNFGFGSLVWVYASESFPARLRTMGASGMLTADLVANLIIALYFLSAIESLGGTATFAMFAALAVVAFGFVWWLAPETKGRPLEAIRAYWENGGAWPAGRATRRRVGRRTVSRATERPAAPRRTPTDALGRRGGRPAAARHRRHRTQGLVEHHEVRVVAGGEAALAAVEAEHPRGVARGQRDRVAERNAEPAVRVAHGGVHRQRAAGQAARRASPHGRRAPRRPRRRGGSRRRPGRPPRSRR